MSLNNDPKGNVARELEGLTGVVNVREVHAWPDGAEPQFKQWWILDNRGSAERPLYTPVSGPYPTKRAAESALKDLR